MRRALALLRRRNRSVRPTGRGWQAIFFGVLSLVVAYLIGTTQIYQLAYALLALPVVALVLGFWLSRGLSHARKLPTGERPTAGRETSVDLLVSNSSRAASPRVEVVDRLPKPRRFELPPVEGRGTRRDRVPVSFPRRGLYELGPAELRTTDPFGLLRFVRRFPETAEVVVYPEVHGLPGFPLRGTGADAGTRGSISQRGDEFSGLREYRRGDERRHIHWKSVARTGELVVKEFAADAPRRYAVVLDLQRAGLRGVGEAAAEVEDAVSAAASVLSHLTREGLPSKLLLSDRGRGATVFGSGEGQYGAAMRLLAMAEADGNEGMEEFLEGVPRSELGEGVVLISRSVGDALVQGVARSRAAGLSVVVVAVAAHTYRGRGAAGGGSQGREAAFADGLRRLEGAGATVRVVRREGGVRGLAGAFDGGGRGGRTDRGAV